MQDAQRFQEQLTDATDECEGHVELSTRIQGQLELEKDGRTDSTTRSNAKKSYDLHENWGTGDGSQFLKEFCWAFLDALGDGLEDRNKPMEVYAQGATHLDMQRVAIALKIAASVMKRTVRRRMADLGCSAESTR